MKNKNNNKKQLSTINADEQNLPKDYDQLAKKLKARLQYARFKVQNGMADQSLEQMENKVERKLSYLELLNSINHDFTNKRGDKLTAISNDGFPPTPPQTQRRGRRSRKSEREEEERAARNLMMISSSPGRNLPKRPHYQQTPPPVATPSSNISNPSSRAIDYTNMNSPTLPSFQDVVSRVPDYDRKSRQFAESIQHTPPPVGALPIDPGSISSRFPYFPPVNWTGALSPVDNPYSNSGTRTPPSPGYRYTMNRLH